MTLDLACAQIHRDHCHVSGEERPYGFVDVDRLIEKTARGGLICPFADIHVDMHMTQTLAARPPEGIVTSFDAMLELQ